MHLTIGTRGSRLAVWQAHHVQDLLRALDIDSEIQVIKTRGDAITDRPFSKMEGKGFFTKELEDAQRDGRVDLAVHSAKDLETEMPEGLRLVALIDRQDPRDALIAHPDAVDRGVDSSLPLGIGTVVGTSSARRQALVRHLRPDLQLKDLRGNVRAGQSRRVGRRVPVTFRGGPLDGMRVAVEAVAATGMYLGWCAATPYGPVQVLYRADGGGVWSFDCLDGGVR